MKYIILVTLLVCLVSFLSVIPTATAIFGKKKQAADDDDSPLAGLDSSIVDEMDRRNNPGSKGKGYAKEKPAMSDAQLGLSELAKVAQDPKIMAETMAMLQVRQSYV